jgi:hypothetical protein
MDFTFDNPLEFPITPKQIKRLRVDLSKRRAQLEAEAQLIDKIEKHAPEFPDGALVTFAWECKESPLGFCVYNPEEDPCHDDCLYCHDPEERK